MMIGKPNCYRIGFPKYPFITLFIAVNYLLFEFNDISVFFE
jgi:hypothetical protein